MKSGSDDKLMVYLAIDTIIGLGIFWVVGLLWAAIFWAMSPLAYYIFVHESDS